MELDKLLSKKEIEVVHEVYRGGTNEDIARSLNISINTVKTHLQHIYKKVNVHNKAGLIIKSMEKSDSSVDKHRL